MKGNDFIVNVESTRHPSTKDNTNMMMDIKIDNKVHVHVWWSLFIAVTYGTKIFCLIREMARLNWLI